MTCSPRSIGCDPTRFPLDFGQWSEHNRNMTTTQTTAQPASFLAYIATDDGTEQVDIRTLSASRLTALRSEAGAYGDDELVEAIDFVLGR